MKRYREEKQKIEEVKWFKNGYKFSVMMQARSDTLLLGWRDFKDEKGKLCKLCNQMVVETLEHFLIKCPGLQEVRNKYVFLQLPRQEDEEALIKMMLLLKIDTEISNFTMINCVASLQSSSTCTPTAWEIITICRELVQAIKAQLICFHQNYV